MGYLFHILLAMGVVTLGQLGLDAGLELPFGAVALGAVPYLLARWIVRQSLRGRFRSAGLLALLLGRAAPLLHLAAVLGFGWVASAERWTGGRGGALDAPETVVLLGLLPYAVYELLVIDARVRLADPRREERRRMRGFQVRMFLSGIVPLAVFLAATWAIGLNVELRAYLEEVALYNAVFAALLLAGFALFLPLLLCNTWETIPLERGLQRDVLEAVARAAGFRCRSIRRWKTGGQMANAAIVGFAPWHRIVLFSDALLAELTPRQLAAVFGHEIGHARRHHVTIFAAWSLGFFMAAHLLLEQSPIESETGLALAIAALGGLWYLGFGYLSRRFELEADLAALDLGGEPHALFGALERVSGHHGRRKRSWRHFSTVDRKVFLRAASRDPGVGQRLRRTLRRWAALGALLFLVTLGLEIRGLAASYGEDSVRAHLRLGRFEEAGAAAERLAAEDAIDPDLVALTVFARSLPEGTSADELEARSLAALRRGEVETAGAALSLAVLRGRWDLTEPRGVLELLAAGDLEGAREAIRALADWEPEPGSAGDRAGAEGADPAATRAAWRDALELTLLRAAASRPAGPESGAPGAPRTGSP